MTSQNPLPGSVDPRVPLHEGGPGGYAPDQRLLLGPRGLLQAPARAAAAGAPQPAAQPHGERGGKPGSRSRARDGGWGVGTGTGAAAASRAGPCASRRRRPRRTRAARFLRELFSLSLLIPRVPPERMRPADVPLLPSKEGTSRRASQRAAATAEPGGWPLGRGGSAARGWTQPSF